MLRAVGFVALVTTVLAAPHTSNLNNGRVVGGTDVPAGKYPSMVSFLFNGKHGCGGTILNEYWVLISARCVNTGTIFSMEILAGTVNLNRGGTRHLVIQVVYHENFDPFTYENDVAVIKVQSPFKWSDTIQPVTLPAQGQETPVGSLATLIGWGYNTTEGSVLNILQEADYWTVSDDECQAAHSDPVFSTNICALDPDGVKGQCSEDNGGPLWVNGYQAGIVSWSIKPCEFPFFPGVYTEVSAFIDWINANMDYN